LLRVLFRSRQGAQPLFTFTALDAAIEPFTMSEPLFTIVTPV
jgi:hypothetical protein